MLIIYPKNLQYNTYNIKEIYHFYPTRSNASRAASASPMAM